MILDINALRERTISLLGAALITMALFTLVVPLSHWLAPTPPEDPSAPVQTVVLPPPPPPAPENVEMPTAAPALAAAPAPPSTPMPLTALPIEVPKPAGSSTGRTGLERFGVQASPMAEIEIFEVAELDRNPRLISSPPNVIPYELQREGIRGQVRLKILISPNGHVKVLEVVSTDHERLVKFAKSYAEKCQFEPPLRNNLPVTARYYFPITY